MAEFPEARIRLRSGMEWADQKTVMEAWTAAPEQVREQFAARVDSVSDADLVAVCEDLVAAVHQLRADAPDGQDGQDGNGGEQDPPHDPPTGTGDENTPDPEAKPKPRGRRPARQ